MNYNKFITEFRIAYYYYNTMKIIKSNIILY